MKTKALVLAICVLSTLYGCSDKPGLDDVERGIREGWGQCKNLEVTDIKKVNGIDHGENYQMTVSYKLKVLNDLVVKDSFPQNFCPLPLLDIFVKLAAKDGNYSLSWKKGLVVNVETDFTMIKSENGWVQE